MGGFRLVNSLLLLAGAAALWVGVASFAEPAAPSLASAAAAGHVGVESGTWEPDADAARRKKRRRPGCGRFCRQAGGFGAGPDSGRGPVLIHKQRVRADRDWIIAVRATCRRSKECVGAILIEGRVSYGRADLRIPARATRRVEVGIRKRGRRSLRRRGPDRDAFAAVPLTDFTLSVSRTLTLIAPR